MVLDDRQNFVSTQYFENELWMHWPLPDLGLNCYASAFATIQHVCCPWLLSNFRFRSISCERIDGVSSMFAYALTVTISRLGLLAINFRKFTTVMAFDYLQNFVSSQYFENELMEWNFAYVLLMTRSRLGLLRANFCKFTTQLWPLVIVKISYSFSIFRTNRWGLIKFCICTDLNQI